MFSEDFDLLPKGFFSEVLNDCARGANSYDLTVGKRRRDLPVSPYAAGGQLARSNQVVDFAQRDVKQLCAGLPTDQDRGEIGISSCHGANIESPTRKNLAGRSAFWEGLAPNCCRTEMREGDGVRGRPM